MSHLESPQRLCPFCRTLEPGDQLCPLIRGVSPIPDRLLGSNALAYGLAEEDANQIRALQAQPSALCGRCSSFDILSLFLKSQPLDILQRRQLHSSDPAHDNFMKSIFSLGPLSSMFLSPSCPFCRLLYCILPRNLEFRRSSSIGEDIESQLQRQPHVYLTPYRTYGRGMGWEIFSESQKIQFAVVLQLDEGFWRPWTTTESPSPIAGNESIRNQLIKGPVIAVETKFLESDRTVGNFKPLESKPDLSHLRQALDLCIMNHSDTCHTEKPDELRMIRVVDVIERLVVPYLSGSDYVALSYVWGGIEPRAGALKNRCLPLTIEDAITVTKALEIRYLWVDSLCIDQSPCLTEAQIKEREEELDMMSTIYGCATITIAAVHGRDADSGLAGISAPRSTQVKETIGGCNLFTTAASLGWELDGRSVWSTRAWTFQEEILSRRVVYFTSGQGIFGCQAGQIEENLDFATLNQLTGDALPSHPAANKNSGIFAPLSSSSSTNAQGSPMYLLTFMAMVSEYTSRQMTHDKDSLNAFRGQLNLLRDRVFPQGFVHGLPLRNYIISLAWVHAEHVIPKRRAGFPSWSWIGWEGKLEFPEMIHDIIIDWSTTTTTRYDELEPIFLACHENEIEIEGWIMELEIRTEPLSEVFLPGREESVGYAKEGEFYHHNTLPTGHYYCLLMKIHFGRIPRGKRKDTLFLLALDKSTREGQFCRRALLTVSLWPGESSDPIARRKEIVRII